MRKKKQIGYNNLLEFLYEPCDLDCFQRTMIMDFADQNGWIKKEKSALEKARNFICEKEVTEDILKLMNLYEQAIKELQDKQK